MARKLFISFLGTGFYRECTYYDDKGNYTPTRFIQQATLEQIGADKWEPTDAVRIFITAQAYKDNWTNSIETRKDLKIGEEVPYLRLQHVIENMRLACDVKAVTGVPIGNNEQEMWKIFQKVYDEIKEGDELYIDLTHAFRYLPMLVLVLSNYSKFLKHSVVKHLSYGNWEGRDASTNRAPIVDLLPLTMLQDWTNAAADFLNYGYAGELKKAIRDKLLPLLKDDKRRTQNVVNVNQLGTTLESYVEERITCRGMDIASGKALNRLISQLDKIEDTGIAALNPIFHKLKVSISNHSDIPSRCVDAAKWCYDMHLYQQAITILQEGINTFFCLRNGIKIDDEVRRDYVGRAFKIKSEELKPGGKKNNDCGVADNVYMRSLLKDDLLNNINIVNQYTTLSGTRNDFNHSGYRSIRIPMKPVQIKDKIKQALKFFAPILLDSEGNKAEGITRKVFLNLSNHPSAVWSKIQIDAAKEFGEVIDFPFPDITAADDKSDIKALAQKVLKEIKTSYDDTELTVHIMGEMTFTYELVNLLKAEGIKCVASCTERVVQDLGNGKRISQFNFEKFREY